MERLIPNLLMNIVIVLISSVDMCECTFSNRCGSISNAFKVFDFFTMILKTFADVKPESKDVKYIEMFHKNGKLDNNNASERKAIRNRFHRLELTASL